MKDIFIIRLSLEPQGYIVSNEFFTFIVYVFNSVKCLCNSMYYLGDRKSVSVKGHTKIFTLLLRSLLKRIYI